MYFEDFALCRYHFGPLDAASWKVPLLAVGWLEQPHRYSRGVAPESLRINLERLVHAAGHAYSGMHFRGLHTCSLCAKGSGAAHLESSYMNLLIPGVRVVYAAPAAILHYIQEHSYLPPAEFVAAVGACPPYGSQSYELALRGANLNCPTPLDAFNEEARKLAERIAQRTKSRGNT
jgi:hypothetical protein